MEKTYASKSLHQREIIPEFPALGKLAVRHAAAFALSLVFSLGGKPGYFAPFGVSAAAAAGAVYMPASVLGASLGYMLSQNSLYSLRYIASLLACGVLIGTLKNMREIVSSKLFAPAIAFVTLLVTGLALTFSETPTLIVALKYLTEAVTGACGAYFIARTAATIVPFKSFGFLSSKDMAALMITAALLLSALGTVKIGVFVPVRVIAALLVLICARYTREAGGAIVGVCTGVALSISGDSSMILAGYGFGGLLGGVFSQLGRFGTGAAFLIANAVIAVMDTDNPAALAVLAEAAAATVLFLLIPGKLARKIEEILAPGTVSPVLDSVKNDIEWRLHNAAQITGEIAASLNKVSDTLKIGENTGMQNMYACIRCEVCDTCGLKEVCFEQSYDTTVGAFNDIVLHLRDGGTASFSTLPPHFASRCIRINALCDSFNRFYREYTAVQKAQNRISQVRNVVSDQFAGISYMLTSLSEELGEKTVFDVGAAQRITAALENMGLTVLDVCCPVDKYDRLSADVHIGQTDQRVSKAKLRQAVETALQRKMDMPVTGIFKDTIHLSFKERPLYRAITGSAQFTAEGERVCGDAFSCFTDEKGFFYAVVSDGMGTGAKAAVCASLTVSLCENLIKAGFGVEASLRAINAALIVKSGEEMSVTLDIVMIDLYTGQAVFYKSGAAATLLKRRGKLVKIELPSLPLGILRDCETVCTRGLLDKGDVVLLTTDGIGEESLNDIGERIIGFKGGEISAFVRELAAHAKAASGGKKDDDITAVAVALVKE